jgi:hypothetical protein
MQTGLEPPLFIKVCPKKETCLKMDLAMLSYVVRQIKLFTASEGIDAHYGS